MSDRPFAKVQEELAELWQHKLDLAGTDEERGKIMLDFILECERVRNGIGKPGALRDALDRKTLAKLTNPDELGPEHSLFEGTIRRLCNEPAAASVYLERAIRQRSAAQSKRASKPRSGSRDSITLAIEEILEDSPKITAKEVGRELGGREDIDFTGDEYRHRSDSSALRVSNLDSRVSDARKRVSG